MNKIRTLACAGALVATAVLAGGSAASAQSLTVTAWGGPQQEAQRQFLFEPFAAETGVNVIEDTWTGGYGVIESMVTAGNPKWDVMDVEADELELGCADGMYEPIDWERIGGRDQFIDGATHDCGVGVFVWSVALVYDGDVFPEGPTGWSDFWDVEAFPGARGMRRTPKYTLEFALMADGVPVAEVYDVLRAPGGVDRAFAKLDELKPNIVWYDSGAQMVQLVVSGQVSLIAGFDGRVNSYNNAEDGNLRIVWPGSIYSTDFWVVLRGSRNVDLAMDFIAFASRPENLGQMPAVAYYGVPHRQASALVPAEVLDLLPTAPANLEGAIPADVEFWLDNGEELTQRFNAWIGQ